MAYRHGGRPEKYASTVFVASFVAELVYNQFTGASDFRTFSPFRLVLDTSVFIGLLLISLRANRWWPMWLSALQLIVVAGHISAWMRIPAIAGVYWGMTAIPFYPENIILLAGIQRHRQRLAMFGHYPDWSVADR
ncbi:MAG: hypothetical protein ACKOOL_02895 [Novosphingobium sp.]